MSENNKVIRFDLTNAPTNEIEAFRERISGFAFLKYEDKDPQTNKVVFIRAVFGENEDIEELTVGFSGITYTDITGTDLLNF